MSSSDIVTLSIITNDKGSVTKKISISKENRIVKDASASVISSGILTKVSLPFLELPQLLQSLKPNQAIIHGVSHTGENEVKIVSKSKKISSEFLDFAITRTKDNLVYPNSPGTFYIDDDPTTYRDHINVKSNEAFLLALTDIFYGFGQVPTVLSYSTGSHLYVGSRKITKEDGRHWFFGIKEPSDLPRFKEVLFKRAWLKGYGYIFITRDGRMLPRTIFDKTVISSWGIQFCVGADCKDGISQKRPKPTIIYPNLNPFEHLINTRHLVNLTPSEEITYSDLIYEAKKKLENKAKEIRLSYKRNWIKQIAESQNVSKARAEIIIESRLKGVLVGSDLLKFDEAGWISVGQVLSQGKKFDGLSLADPLEPEYGGGRSKSIFYANEDKDNPIVFSFAHGGQTFRLKHDFGSLSKLIEALSDQWSEASFDEFLVRSTNLILAADLTPIEQEQIIHLFCKPLNIKSALLKKQIKLKQDQIIEDRIWESEKDIVKKFNIKHACVNVSGKFRILKEVKDPVFKRDDIVLLTQEDFQKVYKPLTISIHEGQKVQKIEETKIWLNSANRKTFQGIVMNPKKIGNYGGYYNLFKGWAVESIKGNCSLIKKHIFEVIANSNDKHYNYIMDWLASLIQKPSNKNKVMLVLKGDPGVGKSILFEKVIAPIIGRHYIKISDSDQLTGKFNNYMKDCFLFVIEEGFWAGDHRGESKLKDLSTSETLMIESKGIDAYSIKNYLNFVFISNSDWVVPVSVQDRRYCVFQVSSTRKGQKDYFNELVEEIENKGNEAFLWELENRDLSNSNLLNYPKTKALEEQSIYSSNPLMDFWWEFYNAGELPGMEFQRTTIQEPIANSDLFQAYLNFCSNSKLRTNYDNRQSFLVKSRRYMPEQVEYALKRDNSKSGRRRYYFFPPLKICRGHWEQFVGRSGSWDYTLEELEDMINQEESVPEFFNDIFNGILD